MYLLTNLIVVCATLEWISGVRIGLSRAYTNVPSTKMNALTTDPSTESTSEDSTHHLEFLSTENGSALRDLPLTTNSETPLTTTAIPKGTPKVEPTTANTKQTKSTSTETTRKTTVQTKRVNSATPTIITASTTTDPDSSILNTVAKSENDQHEDFPSDKHSTGLKYYCDCDLSENECDINCCCDSDCEAAVFKVFNCFTSPTIRPDLQYPPGLPSCKINDGWLCVFRSNVKEDIQYIPNILADTTFLYKWPNLMLQTGTPQEKVEDTYFYKSGQPLQMIELESMEIKVFDLPYAFSNSHCQIKSSIKHLESFRTDCLVNTLEELQQYKQDLLDTIRSYRILRKPLQMQLIDTEKIEKDLIETKVKRCILRNSISYSNDCFASTSQENEVENYYAIEIEILFKHNFTTLLECVIKMKELEIKYPGALQEYWQIFAVQFIYDNEAFEHHQKDFDGKFADEDTKQAISGPLGYILGEPLIMAQYVSYNTNIKMNNNNRVLDYFQPSGRRLRKHHSLYLMSKRRNLCTKDALGKDNAIKYGINEVRQCHVRLENIADLTMNPTERNFTVICVKLQNLAMGNLLAANEMTEVFISELGKPAKNTAHKWTELQWVNVEFSPVAGVYNEATNTFTCRNMLLDISYQFQIGTFMEQGVPHQHLLKQAILTYGQRHDLEFILSENLELPLSVSVMFYNFALEEQHRSNGVRSQVNLNMQYVGAFVIVAVYECSSNWMID